MVSFWPDSIWTPEFTDLATVSPSPHRHLDGMAVAAAAAVLTKNVPLATSVVDTVRRHPSLLAQSALTIDHLAKGRFILGLGSGETENTVPYGFDFTKPVSRFEEALKVIRLLWDSDGPVDFDGRVLSRCTTPASTPSRTTAGARRSGSARAGRACWSIVGRYADGWWPAGAWTPEDYAEKLAAVRTSAERGRARSDGDHALLHPGLPDRPRRCGTRRDSGGAAGQGVPPAGVGRDARAASATSTRWGRTGAAIRTSIPATLTRERIVEFLDRVEPESILAVVPHGTPKQVAQRSSRSYVDAGLRVPKILDYGGMAGLRSPPRRPTRCARPRTS